MMRPTLIWTTFGLCLAVVLAALAWLSAMVMQLDSVAADAWRRAGVEGNVRMALWRMDSALAPLIAREGARPYFAYSAFFPAERAYTRMYNEIQYGDVLVPSPLLKQVSPHIRLHFQIDAAGNFSSPQVPEGNMRDLAETRYVSDEQTAAAAARLEELQTLIDHQALAANLPLDFPAPLRSPDDGTPMMVQTDQRFLNTIENEARNRAVQQAQMPGGNIGNYVNWSVDVRSGALTPTWNNGALLLARRVAVNGREFIQGCWLEWPAIERWLCDEIADLFPEARCEPLMSRKAVEAERILAALPVRLEPGRPAVAIGAVRSPVRLFLTIAWCCVVLAAAAVVVLLFGTITLSERRAAFVSAVTHELRTPLTTFRLYTDLLADGLVKDEAKRKRYLQTLHAEAIRLGHLVENVLAYARLERNRGSSRAENLPLENLLDRVRERLVERATQAGMTLTIESPDDTTDAAKVRADPGAVDQILFNLVDNACKYAASAENREIRISAERSEDILRLRVRDHGPGIPKPEARRLFEPFRKSAHDAAHSAPGVGLGLALSRRLARRLGGNLTCVQIAGPGACFELTLRVSGTAAPHA